MKKYERNTFYTITITSFLMIIFCSSFEINAHHTHLSFDSLFPVTWYQKSLQSCLIVWQLLSDTFENNNAPLSFDLVLSKLTFAQFCLNRMKQQNVILLHDDADYLRMVANKINKLVEVFIVNDRNSDAIECILYVLNDLENSLDEVRKDF